MFWQGYHTVYLIQASCCCSVPAAANLTNHLHHHRPAGEHDWVAAMATVACELHAAFAYFHWTGFYRAAAATPAAAQHAEHAQHEQRPSEQQLVIGPYQGGLGCLRIPFSKGVCGAAARERRTQLVPDVHAFPGHIACASSTQVGRPAQWCRSSGRQPAAGAGTCAGDVCKQTCLCVTAARHRHTTPPCHSLVLQSEVVVPVVTPDGRLLAVLDVDSGALREMYWGSASATCPAAAAVVPVLVATCCVGWHTPILTARCVPCAHACRPASCVHRGGCRVDGAAVQPLGRPLMADGAVT